MDEDNNCFFGVSIKTLMDIEGEIMEEVINIDEFLNPHGRDEETGEWLQYEQDNEARDPTDMNYQFGNQLEDIAEEDEEEEDENICSFCNAKEGEESEEEETEESFIDDSAYNQDAIGDEPEGAHYYH